MPPGPWAPWSGTAGSSSATSAGRNPSRCDPGRGRVDHRAGPTGAGRNVLSATDVYTIFEAYGIPVAAWRVVETADEAVAAAAAIGYPVVVKVDSEAIDHKSDMGGVAINLQGRRCGPRRRREDCRTGSGASAR